MTGFTDVFGGSTVQPSNVSYSAVALSASIPTYWPPYAVGVEQPLSRLMDVTASTVGLAVRLPDATLAGLGQDVFFNNPGANTYSVQDSSGNSVATVAPGQQKYIYLVANSTSAGSWRSILFGVGASSPDASQLAGNGLKAVGSTLVQTSPTSTISANQVWSSTDRAKVYVNTGGAITCTLPLTSVVSNDFFMELRNQGTGTMTISPVGGELIDGSASVVLQLNESCFINAGTGAWYTVGRGRNTQFNFTQLLKTITGGVVTLSLTEASNVVQTYSGVLTSNCTVILPSVVQVYYISNTTTGAFSVTFQSPTPGATLSIPYGQAAVVFCDGANVINASTTAAGLTALLLANGTVSNPSLAVGAVNTGMFAPTSTSLAVTAGGAEQIRWSGNQSLALAGTVGTPSYSFAAYPGTGVYSPAANQWAVATNSTQRLLIDASGNMTPGVDNGQTLGGASFKWSNVYATTFTGSLTGNAATATTASSCSGNAVNVTGVVAIVNGGTGATDAAAARAAIGALGASDTIANATTAQNTRLGGGSVSSNIANGVGALLSNTTGANNTANGVAALYSNTTGSGNTADGVNALANNTTGSYNTADGAGVLQLNTTGVNNTASGYLALYSNTTGYSNTANGVSALYANTTGYNNTANGVSALYANTTGYYNTANGVNALYANTTGINNTASGVEALSSNTTGGSNTANGLRALYANTTGANNTANGASALAANTTGYYNTANGANALYANTTGINNTASGVSALAANTTGSGNTALNPLNALGTYAPVFNPTTENNRFCMGSTGVTNAYIQVAWTVVSDARDKTNFAPVPHGLAFVNALKPVSYQFRTERDSEETNGNVRYGFKAQDVLALEGENPVIVDNEDVDKLRMIDTALIPVLVKALQELSIKFDAYVLAHP
jgi:hypothetical protein